MEGAYWEESTTLLDIVLPRSNSRLFPWLPVCMVGTSLLHSKTLDMSQDLLASEMVVADHICNDHPEENGGSTFALGKSHYFFNK